MTYYDTQALINIATRYVQRDGVIPLDLFAKLLERGIDAGALERELLDTHPIED
jgi:hypothetical protein